MHRATNERDVREAGPVRSSKLGGRGVLLLAGPFAMLALVIAVTWVTNPVGSLRANTAVVEELAVEAVRLSPDLIDAQIRNVSSVEVTVAQVLVNDAYWNHQIDGRSLERLQSSTVTVNYPWDEGLPLTLSFITAAGTRIDHEVPVALNSPARDTPTMARYAYLGLLIGVVPVAIGLLWYPALRRISARLRAGVLGVTAGLLAFLLVDTLDEGLEVAALAGAAVNAVGLLAVGGTMMVALIVLIEEAAGTRAGGAAPSGRGGLATAYVLALAIGLHNLGEGLAVATAIAVGEAALGTTLLLGFILHNSTEGLAIAMPIGRGDRVRPVHFVGLGAVAGLPASLGAVVGSWSVGPAWVTLAFGAAAGALAQVLWALRPSMFDDPRHRGVVAAGFTLGLVVMYGTGLFTG